MPERICNYCGRVHPRGTVCNAKREYRRLTDEKVPKYIREFRHSEWNKIRAAIVDRDHYGCLVCRDMDQLPRDPRLEVHHIIPLIKNFKLRAEPTNLITLCREHHEAAERGGLAVDYLNELVRRSIDGQRDENEGCRRESGYSEPPAVSECEDN